MLFPKACPESGRRPEFYYDLRQALLRKSFGELPIIDKWLIDVTWKLILPCTVYATMP